tara:strand:+ start:8265 stop:9326 length:1062 start_codon:yes stop_codon:yes gene_type:complete
MIKNFLITKNKTLKEAMQLINLNGQKCLIVVDKKNRLIGSLSDGDIRKFLLKNYKLEDKITGIFNENPKYIYKKNLSEKKLKELFLKNNLDIVPVINDKKIVIDVFYPSKIFNKSVKDDTNSKKIIDLKVIIMAGGEGTRMKPFTQILPKPLIPINDKPVIEHIVERFSNQGFKNFVISVNHKAEIIKAYFKELKFKNKILFIKEKIPLGTAGSLRLLQDIKKSFFVVNCDTIVNLDFKDFYDFHKKKKNKITIVASAKEHIIPYGVCNLSSEGRLKNISEKPKINFLAMAGIYCVEPDVIKLIPKSKKFDFPELVLAAKLKKMKIGVFPINDDSWLDTGQWQEYKKAIDVLG